DVREAKKVLVSYAHAHPDASGGNLGVAPAKPIVSKGDASSSSPSSTSSSTTSKKKQADEDALPRAMALYPFMMRDPVLGPIGLPPRFVRLPDPFTPATSVVSTGPQEGEAGGSAHASSWHAGGGTTSTTSYGIFGSPSSPGVSSSSLHTGASSASSS